MINEAQHMNYMMDYMGDPNIHRLLGLTLTPDAALHFAWVVLSWTLALNMIVFVIYYQLRLSLSYFRVSCADFRLVLCFAPICIAIGLCGGFLFSGGFCKLQPCIQLILTWIVFSSLVFMVAVGATSFAGDSLAPSVSTAHVGVQVSLTMPSSAATQVSFPAMSPIGFCRAAGTSPMATRVPVMPSSMATQLSFPVLPCSVPKRVPFPAMPTTSPRPSLHRFVMTTNISPPSIVPSPTSVRPPIQSRLSSMTTAMVFRLVVPYLDSYEILFTTKCASTFISSTPAVFNWWLQQARANRFVADVSANVLRTSNGILVRPDPGSVMEIQTLVQFESSTSSSPVSAARFTDLDHLVCSYCGKKRHGFEFCWKWQKLQEKRLRRLKIGAQAHNNWGWGASL